MAESGLSIGASDLRSEIGEFIGSGRGVSPAWSAAQLADINLVMNSGIRRVYYPPAVSGDTVGYEWSWLKPYATLSVVSGTDDYDLPDDFGRILGELHYPAEENRKAVVEVPVSDILEMRSGTATTGAPWYFGVRWKSTDGSNGQRQELLLFPEPDNDWTMPYKYEAYNAALSDSYPYPLGGMKMAELYIESCLAVVEQRLNDSPGVHSQQFDLLLVDAVARDRRQDAAFYGQMGQPRMTDMSSFRRGYTGGTYPITYGGNDL